MIAIQDEAMAAVTRTWIEATFKPRPESGVTASWDKGTGANYFADGEMAWNNVLNCMRIFKHQWCGSFKDSERGHKLIHPCQKPVALYRDVIIRSKLKPGDWVLETNCGSGASGAAAADLGFDWTGCEIDPGTADRATKRLLEHRRQVELFDPAISYPDLFGDEG